MSADSSVAAPAAPSLELVEPIPSEIPVGSSVALQVRALGAACDLRGGRIEVVSGQDVIATAELITFRDGASETAPFAVRVPDRVEVFTWRVRFPPQEIAVFAHAESTLAITSQTSPHRTSLAVWAVPSSVRMAERFTIMVGAKSFSAACLGGANIEIRDQTGASAGKSMLSDMPWPGSDALYWTEVALGSPSREGLYCWSVAFAATDLELPHLGSAAEFGFTVVRPPEHHVVVTVTERGAAIPVKDTQIALGPYRTATDKHGTAHIEVPTGTYDLAVWKSCFEAAAKTVEIAGNTSLQFELTPLPEELTAWD